MALTNAAVHALRFVLVSTALLTELPARAESDAESDSAQSVTVIGHAEAEGYRATHTATFTKTDTRIEDVPASITVVPAQLIQDQAMRSLADVIRYVPGALAHQGEGNRDQFILRGISTSADLYIDGIRDDAQVFRDLYNLERVEVLKGTAGMIFGRGGAGGIVNRVSRQPVFERVGALTLSLGAHAQRRSTLDVGDALSDTLAWRMNAMGEGGSSFRSGYELERAAVNPSLRWRPHADTRLTVGLEHLHDERTADRGVPARNGAPVDTEPGRFFGNAGQSRARSNVDAAYATLEQRFGGLRLRNALRITRYDKAYQNIYVDNANTSSVDANGLLKLAAYRNANRRTNLFNQTDLSFNFDTAGWQHSLLAGLELGRQDSANERRTGFFGPLANASLIAVSVDAPWAEATAFRANGSDARNRVRADLAAAYLQDEITFSDQWKLLVGLRMDRFRTRFDDRRTTTAATDLARTDTGWSPRLGLIWSPVSGATVYLSQSRSFLPSGEQLSLAPNTASLSPETAINLELGARWDLARRLSLSAAVFRLDRDHVRSPDALNPGFFVQTGLQRTEGMELGLQGELAPGWQLHGGWAHLNGRILRSTSAAVAGARLQLVPDNTLSLWNRIDLPEGWGAGLGVVYQGASFATLDNRVKLPAFTRTDAALYRSLDGGRWQLALKLENLFDRRYFPTADGNNNISPGAPRHVTASLTVRF